MQSLKDRLNGLGTLDWLIISSLLFAVCSPIFFLGMNVDEKNQLRWLAYTIGIVVWTFCWIYSCLILWAPVQKPLLKIVRTDRPRDLLPFSLAITVAVMTVLTYAAGPVWGNIVSGFAMFVLLISAVVRVHIIADQGVH